MLNIARFVLLLHNISTSKYMQYVLQREYFYYPLHAVFDLYRGIYGAEYIIPVYFIMSTPLGGGHIIFAFSAVRRPTWFLDILGNSSYPIFTKFGMQVNWVNSLYGIAFGDDSSIANCWSLVSRHFKECY